MCDVLCDVLRWCGVVWCGVVWCVVWCVVCSDFELIAIVHERHTT
jgi:hypothetical protein